MSVNMQQVPKSLVMTPQFEEKLAAVNGIVIASKIPQGGQLYKKKPWTARRSDGESKTIMICSICSSACRDLRQFRNHFVTCVGRNGNPNGARWDDHLTSNDAKNLRPNLTYAALRGAVAAAARSSEGIPELGEENRSEKEGLAAVNGIVIKYKLSAGQRSSQGIYKMNQRKVHPCIICDRKFARRHHVRVHFPTCVKQNGNPTGAKWDDAWNGGISPAGYMSTQSSVYADLQMEGLRPEDYELHFDSLDNLDPPLASASPDDLQPFHSDLHEIHPQLAYLPPNGVQPYDPESTPSSSNGVQPNGAQINGVQASHPQPTFLSPNGLEPYDPYLRMEVLNNQALFSMFQAWQDVIFSGEIRYTVEHPHFQELMKELVKREMVNVSWKWTVDIERVDMTLTRAMVEGLRALSGQVQGRPTGFFLL